MKLSSFGILSPNLGPSQYTYQLTSQINHFTYVNRYVDICVFTENTVQFVYQPSFPIMSMYYAFNYNFPAIATTITTAKKLIGFPLVSSKFFYVWDLEWMKIKEKDYLELANIYQDTSLSLIARSDDHAKMIENSWGVSVNHVVDNFNISKIAEVVTNGKKC